MRVQKIIDLACAHRALRAVFADELKRLERIKSFVRAGAGPNQRRLLGRARRSRFVASEIIIGQAAGRALNRFYTIWRPRDRGFADRRDRSGIRRNRRGHDRPDSFTIDLPAATQDGRDDARWQAQAAPSPPPR